ncbi:hypothetical protein [Actinomyces vulturis]|uniref:hypothetical protein n=1 Tax=Actinomyces vulturis TaxID=1857645 RepID=UPI00114655CD|nr:hypothetical protein [Actinomyces vulturis]
MEGAVASILAPGAVIHLTAPGTWSLVSASSAAGYILGLLISLRLPTVRYLLAGSVGLMSLATVPLFAFAYSADPLIWCLAGGIGGIGLELSGVFCGTVLPTRTCGSVMTAPIGVFWGQFFKHLPNVSM